MRLLIETFTKETLERKGFQIKSNNKIILPSSIRAYDHLYDLSYDPKRYDNGDFDGHIEFWNKFSGSLAMITLSYKQKQEPKYSISYKDRIYLKDSGGGHIKDGLTYIKDMLSEHWWDNLGIIYPKDVKAVKNWLNQNSSRLLFADDPWDFLKTSEIGAFVHKFTVSRAQEITDPDFVKLFINTFTREALQRYGLTFDNYQITLPSSQTYSQMQIDDGSGRIGMIVWYPPSYAYITLSKFPYSEAEINLNHYNNIHVKDDMVIYDNEKIIGYIGYTLSNPRLIQEWIDTNKGKLVFATDPFAVMAADPFISTYISRYHPALLMFSSAIMLI